MTTAMRSATRRFDAADLTAGLHKLRPSEGSASFANGSIPDRIRRRIVLRHLALAGAPEPPATGHVATEPAHPSGAGQGGVASGNIREPYYAPINVYTPINLASGILTESGTLVIGSGVTSGLVSGIISTSSVYSGPLDPSGILWGWSGFAPALPLQINSQVGNETNVPTEEDIREMESADFLDTVYAYVSSGRAQTAIVAVIDYVDRLLNDGLFRVCDRLLAQANLGRMPSNVRRAFLMVTRPAKDKLPTRAAFYEEAVRLLSQERNQEAARKMLKNLA